MENLIAYLPGILLVYGAFILGLLSPGPNILAVIGTSMSEGRRSGKALAMGVSTGSFLWGGLTMTGLSALLVAYSELLIVIKVVGGLYLLWLAWKAFRSAASKTDLVTHAVSLKDKSWFSYYLRGLTVTMTNPKAAMSWIAIMSLGVQAEAPIWVALVIILGTGTMSVIGHMTYALAFSTPTMVRIYGRARRGIQATLGAFFAFAGLKLLFSRV